MGNFLKGVIGEEGFRRTRDICMLLVKSLKGLQGCQDSIWLFFSMFSRVQKDAFSCHCMHTLNKLGDSFIQCTYTCQTYTLIFGNMISLRSIGDCHMSSTYISVSKSGQVIPYKRTLRGRRTCKGLKRHVTAGSCSLC